MCLLQSSWYHQKNQTKTKKQLEATYCPSEGYNWISMFFSYGLEQYAALNLGGTSIYTDLKEWNWYGIQWTTMAQKCKLQATIP